MAASRIANVSAALVGCAQPAPRADQAGDSLAALLPLLFEDVIRIAAPDGAAARAQALLAARGERVIVVREGEGRASADLLLALVAWPERAVVEVFAGDPVAGGDPIAAIYRREGLVERARALRAGAGPADELARVVPEAERLRVDLARLGLDDGPIALFLGGSPGSTPAIRTAG